MLAVSPVFLANTKPVSFNDVQNLKNIIFAINPFPDTLAPTTPVIHPYPSSAHFRI